MKSHRSFVLALVLGSMSLVATSRAHAEERDPHLLPDTSLQLRGGVGAGSDGVAVGLDVALTDWVNPQVGIGLRVGMHGLTRIFGGETTEGFAEPTASWRAWAGQTWALTLSLGVGVAYYQRSTWDTDLCFDLFNDYSFEDDRCEPTSNYHYDFGWSLSGTMSGQIEKYFGPVMLTGGMSFSVNSGVSVGLITLGTGIAW